MLKLMLIALAILFGWLSMLGYGLANVFSQPLAKKYGPAQVLFLRSFAILVILAVGAAPSFQELSHYKEVLLTLGLGALGYLPVLAFTHGIRISRLGIVAPIAGTSPLITVVLSSLVLNTQIHLLQWLAILVVIGANVAMSVDLKNWRNSSLMRLSSGIPFAFMATLGWGFFFFFLIYATRWLGPWLSAFLVEAGVTLAAGLHLLFSSQAKVPLKQAVSRPVLLNSVLICIGTVAYTVGVRRFNVSVVAALSNSTAIVSAVVASYKFHEHLTRTEKIAGATMVAGIAVISFF